MGKHSQATKDKISSANRGKVRSPEQRAAMAVTHKLAARNPVIRAQNAEKMRLFWASMTADQRREFLAKRQEGRRRYQDSLTAEQRAGLSARIEPNRLKAVAAYRQKMAGLGPEEMASAMGPAWAASKAKGYAMTPEHRLALTNGRRNTPVSTETRALMSARATGRKRTDEAKQKLRDGWAKFTREERQQKLSAGVRALQEQWKTLNHDERIARTAPGRRAAQLANPSSLERSVAVLLESLGITFDTQHVIGRYIVDFFLPDRNLVIECDGSYWHSLPGCEAKDKRRDEWLVSHGYSVLRLPESDIVSGAVMHTLSRLKAV